jgi:hypothetical protein
MNFLLTCKVEIIILFFGLGYTIRSFSVRFVDGWEIYYEPSYAHIFSAIPTIWVIGEIIKISWDTYKTAPAGEKLDFLLILLGWFSILLSILFVLIERLLTGRTLYYLIITSLGFLVISLTLTKTRTLLYQGI